MTSESEYATIPAMPPKGTKYAVLDIDLEKWARDEIAATGEKKIDLATRLNLARPRVTELFQGKANTIYMLEKIVGSALKGDYMRMARYAKTKEGLRLLKDLTFRKGLSPYQEDLYDRLCALIQHGIKKNPEKVDKLLDSDLKKLFS